jgi:hypothetical protein
VGYKAHNNGNGSRNTGTGTIETEISQDNSTFVEIALHYEEHAENNKIIILCSPSNIMWI